MAPSSPMGDPANRAGFAALTPGETPSAEALWQAVGKTRGLIEALAPGVGFLTVYTLTGNLLWSVSAPAGLAVVFILARVLSKTPVMSAIAGLIGIAASAGVALWSGRAEDNFLLGFGVNALFVVVLLISLLLRRPLIGFIAAMMVGDDAWYRQKGVVRVAVWATWLWIVVFSARLGVQVPLYVAGEVAALALTKLVMGLPLYAAALWFTWLLMRAVYGSRTLEQK